MATLQELLEQQAALARQIAEAQGAARGKALAQVKTIMFEHGLTAADIVSAPAARKASGSTRRVAAKYRHPHSGATWSGRGLRPRWLAEEIAAGRSLEDFAI